MSDPGARGARWIRAAAGLTAAVAALALASPLAWGCPSCATREGPGLSVLALLGGLVAVPYAVAAITIRVIRRLEKP